MIKAFTFMFTGLFFVLSCSTKNEEKLTIATAANMQFAMEEITAEFTKETGIKCGIVPGSSGKLSTLIIEKAPYDIFVSADTTYPNELFNKGIGLKSPSIYAYGKLVLWSCVKTISPDIKTLTSEKINHIALANPETAPYGKAAMELLKFHNLDSLVKQKLVYGESISQTNQFIITNSAEIGFTAKSTVLSKELKSKGKWVELDPSSYIPIAQAALLISNKESAKKFYEFLTSDKAQKILKKYGYLTP